MKLKAINVIIISALCVFVCSCEQKDLNDITDCVPLDKVEYYIAHYEGLELLDTVIAGVKVAYFNANMPTKYNIVILINDKIVYDSRKTYNEKMCLEKKWINSEVRVGIWILDNLNDCGYYLENKELEKLSIYKNSEGEFETILTIDGSNSPMEYLSFCTANG